MKTLKYQYTNNYNSEKTHSFFKRLANPPSSSVINLLRIVYVKINNYNMKKIFVIVKYHHVSDQVTQTLNRKKKGYMH